MRCFLSLALLLSLLPLSTMAAIASGTFAVNMTPAPAETSQAASPVGRMLLQKTFAGDLTGSSTAQMLAVRTPTAGSAGYVALEHVHATLDGRTGSFVLQHSGTMNRGEASLSVTVIPDSGTDGLVGLSGTMTIKQDASGHRYTFDYTLPERP